MKHYIDASFLNGCTIILIGCGGTGSMVLSGLVRLVIALRNLNGAQIHVHVYDPDEISVSNIGRQLFYPSDIGQNKAVVSVNRINLAFGLEFKAFPEAFKGGQMWDQILIGCVDSRKARKEITKGVSETGYFIDCGNGDRYGQVLIGNGSKELPWPWEVLPDLVSNAPEDNTPSCSLAEALESQDLFINQEIALCALKLLWSLFRYGGLDYRGFFINQATGRHIPVPVSTTDGGVKKELNQ